MRVLITGGLGFIGINTALAFMKDGHKVFLFDNLSKEGSRKNLNAFNKNDFIYGDMRNKQDIVTAILKSSPDVIFHFAGQTAVTTSIKDPVSDFEINALGTFNLLDTAHHFLNWKCRIIYASTNKVYGKLENYYKIEEKDKRYRWNIGDDAIAEDCPLDFYSPYGCSKGCADQYMRDYARIYNMHTITVRQSCIYGEYQDGTEDQGWMAWFIKRAIEKKPITIYGNGKQVRDILYIDDLIDFYKLAINKAPAGSVYNIGGGLTNSISLLELINTLEGLGLDLKYDFAEERLGDQKIFISNNMKALKETAWKPKTFKLDGIRKLVNFLNKKAKGLW